MKITLGHLSHLTRGSLLFTITLLTACGTTAKLSPEFSNVESKPIVFLPVKAEPDEMQERVDIVGQTVARGLRNKGYFLLEDSIVRNVCGSPECPEKEKFVENFGAGGFVQLELSSVAQRDFFAGYVNTIAGKLKITDLEGKEVLSAENSENQTGGLIFNSGQLVEGIQSQVENYGDQNFVLQASRFTRGLLNGVPQRSGALPDQEPYVTSISAVKAVKVAGAVTKVCATGTPHALARLNIGRLQANLREVNRGEYCGIYQIPNNGVGKISVELLSPYGSAAKQKVDADFSPSCPLNGLVTLSQEKLGNQLVFDCVTFGSGAQAAVCQAKKQSCALEKALVYKAASEGGPYQKITELKKGTWLDTATKDKPAFYQVIGINREGVLSQPAAATPSAQVTSSAVKVAGGEI